MSQIPQFELDRWCDIANFPAACNSALADPPSARSSPLTNGSCVLRMPKALKCLTRKSSRRRISRRSWPRFDPLASPQRARELGRQPPTGTGQAEGDE